MFKKHGLAEKRRGFERNFITSSHEDLSWNCGIAGISDKFCYCVNLFQLQHRVMGFRSRIWEFVEASLLEGFQNLVRFGRIMNIIIILNAVCMCFDIYPPYELGQKAFFGKWEGMDWWKPCGILRKVSNCVCPCIRGYCRSFCWWYWQLSDLSFPRRFVASLCISFPTSCFKGTSIIKNSDSSPFILFIWSQLKHIQKLLISNSNNSNNSSHSGRLLRT